jgi:DNA-binding IclR family transcriptional regulator
MATLGIKLIEGFRDDYMPREKLWDAFALLLILNKMYELHQHGREASAAAIGRSIGMPRQTVRTKLAHLKKLGFIEQIGHHYLMNPDHLNHPLMLAGFRHRLLTLRQAPDKMLETSEITQATH